MFVTLGPMVASGGLWWPLVGWTPGDVGDAGYECVVFYYTKLSQICYVCGFLLHKVALSSPNNPGSYDLGWFVSHDSW